MAKTIVGCFRDETSVQRATGELVAAGIPRARIQRMERDGATTSRGGEAPREESWKDKIERFFGMEPDDDASYRDEYAGAIDRGDRLLAVDVEDENVDTVAAILQRCGAVNLDQSGARTGTRASATSETRRATTANDNESTSNAIPVVEERMDIGKRVVSRGGVRVHSYVTETPVDELVRLREERVSVQRQPVDRPMNAGDAAFKEQTIEVTAQGEQATVSKTPRVVEEVRVGKRVEERQQRVSERVKKQDVPVEELPKTGTGTKR